MSLISASPIARVAWIFRDTLAIGTEKRMIIELLLWSDTPLPTGKKVVAAHGASSL